MKKKIFYLGLALFLLLAFFLFGPSVGKVIFRAATPQVQIDAWKKENRRLDAIFPRNSIDESQRLLLLRKLAQRGIHPDPGIRDEAIEHNLTPYTIFVRTCWAWEELLGIP